jgi:predicted GTPase
VDKVKEIVHRVASKVTHLSSEKDRLLSKPIDILCFGRAGVGKTTLLEALTGRQLGSTSRVNHGTSKLECCEIHDNLSNKEGNSVKIHIRFWDSKGVEKWTGGDLVELFEELKNQNVSSVFSEVINVEVHPICVLYCGSGYGRINSGIVAHILREFLSSETPVFYVITNLYSHSDETLTGQFEGAMKSWPL